MWRRCGTRAGPMSGPPLAAGWSGAEPISRPRCGASPDHAVAHLLSGVLCLCRDDEAGAARHLGTGVVVSADEPDLDPSPVFRRAMARIVAMEGAAGDAIG